MKDMNLAGAEPEEQRIWNSYVYWARSSFGEPPSDLIFSDPEARLSSTAAQLLHALLFATFALEYRLRSVYELLGLDVRKRDTLWNLISNLKIRTAGLSRKNKPIEFSPEWKQLQPSLQALLELRNKIAHGQRVPVSQLLTASGPTLREQAVNGYNALIDAIRVINVAISYESRVGDDLLEYYSRLKVAVNNGEDR